MKTEFKITFQYFQSNEDRIAPARVTDSNFNLPSSQRNIERINKAIEESKIYEIIPKKSIVFVLRDKHLQKLIKMKQIGGLQSMWDVLKDYETMKMIKLK